ncbi:phosphoribosylaminoimidazolesuccinocarboxamide synthase [Hydrogenivirga sp. 128-5-R1-1]|uniref:phosphoribosylaminoimidazolesuccinocarboxamide synthase n=1 Tax=Hydrogenivirga sp. 128-5-R1-1 TaxID=392423 RepID=UPI00015F37A7|nr:phosphoribosylaminoimidazolesuccinocarboxamide synthase [Hydrogenivirga sp. 128-5-R1-1]EDP76415.1 phosphoribosylaminoimidazole-succinocarboxamide synthase [Hydrogenivirga sp. 128-5-R1-1]
MPHKTKKLYEGKAKVVYETDDPDKLILVFKDTATAFDGVKKAELKGKGALNNTISSLIFEILHKSGIKTHYIEKLSDTEMLVWKAERFLVEVVVRNVAAGSVVKRLGFKEGDRFEKPLLEFFYKNDELHDPLVCDAHIELMKLAPMEALPLMRDTALKVNEVLSQFFQEHGIILVDFKLEFGRLPDGSIGIVDEISPDSMRLWDARTGEKLDKDRFRFDLGDLLEGYRKILKQIF